jgi:hypothetical protein
VYKEKKVKCLMGAQGQLTNAACASQETIRINQVKKAQSKQYTHKNFVGIERFCTLATKAGNKVQGYGKHNQYFFIQDRFI